MTRRKNDKKDDHVAKKTLRKEKLLKTGDIAELLLPSGLDKARLTTRVRNFATAGFLVSAGLDPSDKRGAHLYHRDAALVAMVLSAVADLGLDLRSARSKVGFGDLVSSTLHNPPTSNTGFIDGDWRSVAQALCGAWRAGIQDWFLQAEWARVDGAIGPTSCRVERWRGSGDQDASAVAELRLALDPMLAVVAAAEG